MNKGKIVLTLLSAIVVAALLLAGCGRTTTPTTAPPTTVPPTTTRPPATTAPPTTVAPTSATLTTAPAATRPAATTVPLTTSQPIATPSDMVTVTLRKVDGTTMQKTMRKPQYGGTFTFAATDPLYFDEIMGTSGSSSAGTTILTNDRLGMFDWTLGPAGTGERSFFSDYSPAPREQVRHLGGGLAESLEFVDTNTVVYHIRKGVRWALNPKSEAAKLANGREVTGDDVVASILHSWTAPKSLGGAVYGKHLILDQLKALDNHTVQVKWNPGTINVSWYYINTNVIMWPREVLDKYGVMSDWKNHVGSGAFILTDYVKANSASFIRNPSFWQKDPFFPENQLPYVDNVNLLVIPDVSTRLAALRTAQIDLLYGSAAYPISFEDFKSLTTATPELKALEVVAPPLTIFMHVDKPKQPWYDKRVRQALSMAIDRQLIKDTFYSGHAKIMDVPVHDLPEWSELYVPLSSLPDPIKQLYEYHPDKSKQLLAEAGYPNGFQASVVTIAGYVDWLSIVQNYWATIGVDLKLDVMEPGIVTAMANRRQFTEMYAATTPLSAPYMLMPLGKGLFANFGNIDDPKIETALAQMNAVWPDNGKMSQIYKSVLPYAYDQRWWIPFMAPNNRAVWWPWLANYHGEIASGYGGGTDHGARYQWIDQNMKKKMGK